MNISCTVTYVWVIWKKEYNIYAIDGCIYLEKIVLDIVKLSWLYITGANVDMKT